MSLFSGLRRFDVRFCQKYNVLFRRFPMVPSSGARGRTIMERDLQCSGVAWSGGGRRLRLRRGAAWPSASSGSAFWM